MPFSLFVLVLYVFLQSAPTYGWIDAAPKLTAFVGIVFCIAVIVEGFFWVRSSHPGWFRRTA